MKCLQVNGMMSGVCFQIRHQIQTKKMWGGRQMKQNCKLMSIFEADWLHGNSLYCSPYFGLCLKMSTKDF